MKALWLSIFLLITGVLHAQWADLGTASTTEVHHLCNAVPAPGGLTHDIYCAGENPEVLSGGAISATGIHVAGPTTLTDVSTSTITLSGVLSTTALYVNGASITGAGGGSATVQNPEDCDIGESPTWSTADGGFRCPVPAALTFDFDTATNLDGAYLSNVIQFDIANPAGLNVSLAAATAASDSIISVVCLVPDQQNCFIQSVAAGNLDVDVTIFDTQYLMIIALPEPDPQSVSVTVGTTSDEWVVPGSGGG